MTVTVSREAQLTRLDGAQPLSSGAELPGVEVVWRSWGTLSPTKDNVILVTHALTGSADVDQWWPDLIGPGRPLDTSRYLVLCTNALGSCYGTTGPTSAGPDGAPWANAFPAVDIRDMVAVQRRWLSAIGIERLALVVGGSMGGMQALEWAATYPDSVDRIAVIGAPGRHHAWARAWSDAQRYALTLDPDFRGGAYDAQSPPVRGLAAARRIGMISYRTGEGLNDKFAGAGHEVENWLDHHGRSLGRRFDANSYLTLLEAMDRHDVSRDRGRYADVLASIRTPAAVVAIAGDLLYRAWELEELADSLPNGRLRRLDSAHGHDGFLIDAARLGPTLTALLREGAS